VRLAVDAAPGAKSEEERYWQEATRLELASAAKDFAASRDHLTTLLAIDVAGWMRDRRAGPRPRRLTRAATRGQLNETGLISNETSGETL
jgi:hypothetical protein